MEENNNVVTTPVVEPQKKKGNVGLIVFLVILVLGLAGYSCYDKFFAKCKELDVCAVIIPDMPFEERAEIKDTSKEYGVKVIYLVAPTSHERVKSIAKEAEGFIYIVSSMGVTGVRNTISTNLSEIVSAIREVTDTPCAIGFGISTPEQAKKMAGIADGAIVGSAIVKMIGEYGENAEEKVYEYVKSMKEAALKA